MNIPERTIGILAMVGSLFAALYENALTQEWLAALTPADKSQEQVMKAMYQVKAGNHDVKDVVLTTIKELTGKGADRLILGCTEPSLLGLEKDTTSLIFDPLSILASRAVKLASAGRERSGHPTRLLAEKKLS